MESFIRDYGLDKKTLTFVGGGGGAASVVPHIAEEFGVNFKIARNASVISPIGVALAMVRDMVERTIQNPTEKDILALRYEAIQKAVKSGANPDTVEVRVEVDTQQNKVRAIAIGTTELRAKELAGSGKTDRELAEIAAKSVGASPDEMEKAADNGLMKAFVYHTTMKTMLFFKKKVETMTESELKAATTLLSNAELHLDATGGDLSPFSTLIANPSTDNPAATPETLENWLASINFDETHPWDSRCEMLDMEVTPIWEFIPDPTVAALVESRIKATAPTMQELYGNRNFVNVEIPAQPGTVTTGFNGRTMTVTDPWVVDVIAANRHFMRSTDIDDILQSMFRQPSSEETAQELTATEIAAIVRREYPDLPSRISTVEIGRRLKSAGFQGRHTERGTCYKIEVV